jgi:hypothetical protein
LGRPTSATIGFISIYFPNSYYPVCAFTGRAGENL